MLLGQIALHLSIIFSSRGKLTLFEVTQGDPVFVTVMLLKPQEEKSKPSCLLYVQAESGCYIYEGEGFIFI